MRLNTADLIRILARRHGHVPDLYRIALRDLIDEIPRQLAEGNSVHLIGLGTFSPIARGARTAWDFRSHRRIKIPARRHVSFHLSRALASSLGANRLGTTGDPIRQADELAITASTGVAQSDET